jgi:hypothetical protein
MQRTALRAAADRERYTIRTTNGLINLIMLQGGIYDEDNIITNYRGIGANPWIWDFMVQIRSKANREIDSKF